MITRAHHGPPWPENASDKPSANGCLPMRANATVAVAMHMFWPRKRWARMSACSVPDQRILLGTLLGKKSVSVATVSDREMHDEAVR